MRRFLARLVVAVAAWWVASWLQAAETVSPCADAKFFEIDDLFLAGSPRFEPGKFGQAVENPLGGHESLFLWYPNVLPPEGTLSGWVKPAAGLGCGPLFYNPFLHLETLAYYHGEISYGLVTSPDRIDLRVRRSLPGSDHPLDTNAGRDLKPGQWNHIAVTFSPRETRIYLNGEAAGKGPGLARAEDGNRPFLDLVTDLVRMHCPGLLDEFLIFDRVLPEDEIQDLYRRTEPFPVRDDVVALWRFDGDTKLRMPKRAKTSGGSLFYRTGSPFSLFREETGVRIKFNAINWNAAPVEWSLRLSVADMYRKRVYEKQIPLRLAARSQRQWVQEFAGLPNGMFYGTFELRGPAGAVLDRRGAIFGKTLAPDRMQIPENARFQLGAEAATYCNWPDNGMTFSLVRQSNWADVAPEKGRWDWTVLDAFIDQANANNIHFVLGTAYPPRWAQRPDAPESWQAWPKNMDDWSEYVEALARHCKGRAKYFEVLNEPGYLAPGEYADFVIRAKKAIGKAGADIKVVANHHSGQDWLDQVVEKAKGSFDVLSTHPYMCLTLENESECYPVYLGMLPHVRPRGMKGPWWGTEAGNWGGQLRSDGYPMTREEERQYRAADPRRRDLSLEYFNSQADLANMAARSLLVSFASGVERYSWHYFRAMTPCDCLASHQLLVFGNIAGLLTGGEFVKQLDLGGNDLWAFQFRNKGRTVVAFWQAAAAEYPRKAFFKLGTARYLVTDIYGNSREYKSLGGVAEVEVTDVPQFLRSESGDIGVSRPVLALRVDGVVMPGVEGKVSVSVFNPLAEPLSGKLRLTVLAGVRLAPAEFACAVKPAAEQQLTCTLLVPPGLPLADKRLVARLETDRLGTVERALLLDVRQSVRCPKLAKRIRIDGDLRKWEGTSVVTLDRKNQVTLGTVRPEGDPNPTSHFEWDGRDDLSGRVATAWDEANLYLAVKVRNRGPLYNAPRERGNFQAADEGDCLEVFLDFEPRPGKGYGPNTWRVFFVPPTPDFPSLSWHVEQPAARELAEVQAVGSPVLGGYLMEIKVPWANFAPFKPSAGKVIGFELALDKQDSPGEQVRSFGKGYRKCQIGWGGTRLAPGDRSQFGRMILSE